MDSPPHPTIGAPAIDPEAVRLGRRGPRLRAAKLGSSEARRRGLKAIYSEIGYALQSVLWYGELEPGAYSVPHPLNGEWSWLDRRRWTTRNLPSPKSQVPVQGNPPAPPCTGDPSMDELAQGRGDDHTNPTPGITQAAVWRAHVLPGGYGGDSGTPVKDGDKPLTEPQERRSSRCTMR